MSARRTLDVCHPREELLPVGEGSVEDHWEDCEGDGIHVSQLDQDEEEESSDEVEEGELSPPMVDESEDDEDDEEEEPAPAPAPPVPAPVVGRSSRSRGAAPAPAVPSSGKRRRGRAKPATPVAPRVGSRQGLGLFFAGVTSEPTPQVAKRARNPCPPAKRVQGAIATGQDGEMAVTTETWGGLTCYESDASREEEDADADAEKRPPRRPKLSTRKMSPADLKIYKANIYLAQQARDQVKWAKDHDWLACDQARGRHCKECVQQPVCYQPGDTLSSGYGLDGDGQPKPVPALHKLETHQKLSAHKDCVRRNAVCRTPFTPPCPALNLHPAVPRLIAP